MKNLLTILFTTICFLNYAADLYVFPGGVSPNYSSINTAVNAAADGDRVLVATGTYVENVSIPAKNLTIIPLTDGENYTISGFLKVTATHDQKIITIVGALVQGDFEEVNNTNNSCSGALINEINIINCEFLQNFNPNKCIIVNLYYSTLYLGSNSYVMSKEMIGNKIYNNSNQAKELTCYSISDNWNSAADALYADDKFQKIYANHFQNIKFRVFEAISTPTWTEVIHIANNYFEYYTNFNSTSVQMLRLSLGSNQNVASMLVENNTFNRTASGNNNEGWCIYSSTSYGSLTVRNNLFFSTQGFSTSYPMFYFNMSDGIAIVTNNLFTQSSWSTTLTTANLSNPATVYFGGSLSGGSVNSSDNFFNTSFSSSNIAASSGIVNNSMALNNGLDIMECRDIDDTQNDIGTWGGPHSWDNYHSTSLGKGRVIDLQMPSTIYGLPGVTFDVKSKAIRTN